MEERKHILRIIFAHKIQKLRIKEGITQEELARRSGLHRTYVSMIERAERSATLDSIELLAEALKVHPCDLMS